MGASYPFTSALVTGASSGIGEELTRQLVAAGVPVVAVARRAERLNALAAELGGVEVLVADLATLDGQDAVAARIADEDHPVELVVNNAGFGTSGAFAELDVDRLTEEITVNVTALTRLTHAAARGDEPARPRLAAQRVELRQLPAGAAPRRLCGDQGVRHQPQREPAPGGRWRRRRRDRAVPRSRAHRVPAGQQQRALPGQPAGLRVARRRGGVPRRPWRAWPRVAPSSCPGRSTSRPAGRSTSRPGGCGGSPAGWCSGSDPRATRRRCRRTPAPWPAGGGHRCGGPSRCGCA